MSLQQIWSSVLMDGINNLKQSAAARTKEWSEYEETRPKMGHLSTNEQSKL